MAVGGSGLLVVALALIPRSWWGALASGRPVLLPVAVSLALLVTGILLWRQVSPEREVSAAPTPPGRQMRPLRSWVIPIGVILVGVVTCTAVVWLQGSVPAVGDRLQLAQLRVESIRTGLTIGAAVTAAFALLLAFRRQQLAERTQQATEYDAGEKRVTELYVKAADQLGADKAPVRLAGLYALERLAQDNPAHRQSIVEVICAYLRMPHIAPDTEFTSTPIPVPLKAVSSDTESNETSVGLREERQVRLAAQRILARHLRPTTEDAEPDPSYWGPTLVLDLTEAVLIDADFNGCHLHKVDFTAATFHGYTLFNGTTFSGPATFVGTTFNRTARFDRATFIGPSGIVQASFRDEAWFDRATFSSGAWFDQTTFSDVARFSRATFSDSARFVETTFKGSAKFNETTFSGGTVFVRATFDGTAKFEEATFNGVVDFEGASLGGVRYDGPEPVIE
ncbi:pentapeptide repeat-containing protein [Micromonospora sp. NPDC047793]|uniref:pentapeptide repeat-containing protein n=1 Tax=Micromonospora sp. NPDC047793 TaxID=3154342 RepID=UPI0033EEE012